MAGPSGAARLNTQGPPASGCIAPTSPRSAARRSVRGNADARGGLGQVKPGLFSLHGLAEHWDTVVRTQRRDALAREAFAVPHPDGVTVEHARDHVVARDQRQLAHGLDHVGGRADALATSPTRQAVLGVGAADPVQGQRDFGPRLSETVLRSARTAVWGKRAISRARAFVPARAPPGGTTRSHSPIRTLIAVLTFVYPVTALLSDAIVNRTPIVPAQVAGMIATEAGWRPRRPRATSHP